MAQEVELGRECVIAYPSDERKTHGSTPRGSLGEGVCALHSSVLFINSERSQCFLVIGAHDGERWIVRPDQQPPYDSSSKGASAADVHAGSANEIFSQVEEAIARHTSVRTSERFDPLSVHMALTWKNLNYFVKGE